MEKEKQKFGQAAYDLLRKPPEYMEVGDIQDEISKRMQAELEDIIEGHKNYSKEYYIQIIMRKERTAKNALRFQYFMRRTPAAPAYDTSLFRYNNITDKLDYLWSIPDQDTCEYLLAHETELPSEEKPLLKFVKMFSDGKLGEIL